MYCEMVWLRTRKIILLHVFSIKTVSVHSYLFSHIATVPAKLRAGMVSTSQLESSQPASCSTELAHLWNWSPGGSDDKASVYNAGDRFDPCVGKSPWRRKWQSTPVLLPGKSHGQRSLVGPSPWGRKELDKTEQLHFMM